MNRIFIALDIETTGFDALEDQVIEIGAVKFDSEKTIDTFETLINPGKPIPPIIEHITGINDEKVHDAPHLEDVREQLVRFIGNAPIVGHNISFDVTFLNQKGVHLTNSLMDTLDLSSILLPGLPSYSLDTLTRILKIRHLQKHRALSDTIAAQELFMILLKKIGEIDGDTMEEIRKVTYKSTWGLKDLFSGAAAAPAKQPKKNDQPPQTDITESAIRPEALESFFDDDGPLKKIMDHYEERPSQKQILETLTGAFENGTHVLVEAGTGTGKTIAYLTAALKYALKHHERVVVSTHTKNLQDQIVKNDIPLIQKAIQTVYPDAVIKVQTLKGRRNYISLRRFHHFLTRPIFQDHETSFAIKLILWLKSTQTGDLQEVSFQGREFTLMDEVSYDDLPYEEKEEHHMSFLKQARLKAEQAQIVVVNHALLLNDAEREGILPPYETVIFDEAHHLEKIATETYTVHISGSSFGKIYDQLTDSPVMKYFSAELAGISSRVNIFFGFLGIFMEKYADSTQFQTQYLIREKDHTTMEWSRVMESAKVLIELHRDLLQKIALRLTEPEETRRGEAQELTGMSFLLERQIENLQTAFLNENFSDRINWIYSAHDGHACFKSAPAHVGTKMHQLFFDGKKSVILTSATLRTDNTFGFIREQLGIKENDERFSELALPSHFDYPDQVKILIPEDMPRPMTEGNFLASCQVIRDVVKKNGGRTLVLFTSKRALQATYMQLAPEMKEFGFDILAQGISGGRGKILEHFKEEPEKCALFGTNSFWEGIDIPGNMLTCIIMQKLPFDPPDDPIIAYRRQKYRDSFKEYQVPLAILKFKQGFGRLIRTSKDKGTVILLDSRIIQNSYGQKFLEALPEGIRIEHSTIDNIGNLLEAPVNI